MNLSVNKPITIAITGASGSIYALRTLEILLKQGFKINLICSETALKVAKLELNFNFESKEVLQKHFGEFYPNLTLNSASNLAAQVSSGSFPSQGMIIIPCSMGALGRIACGTSNDLIARSADVCLKERSKLILVVRETPLNSIPLQNMLTVSQAGGIILPAMPAFYHQPQTIDDLVNFVIGKTLDVFGIENNLFERWLSSSFK